ncbi:MAG: CBS domain-containing protein [Actinomycetota bacterium]|nr:CBS domain-containing protein [Actinomycetota bacterium]
MSPRAAWQLEALGFSDVSDYVDGKLDWISRRGATEGKGPHYAVAGEAADRDAVLNCHLGDRLGDTAQALDSIEHDYCVVVNDADIVLGRMRKKNVQGPPDTPIEQIMEPGPTTVRATESASALLERMLKRKVPAVLVTTNKGQLVGVATQDALHSLVHRHS